MQEVTSYADELLLTTFKCWGKEQKQDQWVHNILSLT